MIKKISSIILIFLISFQLVIAQTNTKSISYGIPASQDLIFYVQPDGSTISYYLNGDAVINWKETPEGYVINKGNDNYYYYAVRNANGQLDISKSKVVTKKSLPNNIIKGVPYSEEEIVKKRKEFQNSFIETRSFPPTGTNNLLLILVDFPDAPYIHNNNTFIDMFNTNNYNGTGSFNQYYLENSFGLLDIVTVVKGWYTAPYVHDYYSYDSTEYNNRVRGLVRYCVDQAELDGVDFTQFDNDTDGEVDGIMIIHQGSGAETGDNSCIWSHSWFLGDSLEVNYDGVWIKAYTINPETSGGSAINGIGTACHEFGHNLGIADYYDTNYGVTGQSEHLGAWDVMASGCYNNNSNTPAHHNAYSKDKLGWMTIQELDTTANNVMLLKLEDNPVAYKYTTTTLGEFFLVENRQKVGFDQYIPGHGMLIYHIDENHQGAWNSDAYHQAFDLEEADATTSHGAGDAFPAGKTQFTDITNPSSKAWSGLFTNKPITDIVELTDTIFFNFMQMDNAPVAHFLSDQQIVCEGTTINFTENSAYFADSIIWYFPGGNPGISSIPNPSIQYDTAGTYNVTLIVKNAFGSDTLISTNYIEVGTPQEYSLNFDGSNDRVVIPPLNLHTDTITIEAWVRLLLTQNDWAGIVFCRGDSTVAGLSVRNDNELRYHWDGNNWGWSSGLHIGNSVWTHVALVVTPSYATIYMDDTSATNYTTHPMEEFNTELKIGHDRSGRYLKALVDEIRIWKSVRTPAELEMYKCSIPDPQNEPDLIAYYTFNECGGITLRDSKGNFDGILENMQSNDWVTNYPCMPTNILRVEDNEAINIYPNPSTGEFRIATNSKSEIEIFVYNIEGNLIKTNIINNSTFSLNLNQFPSGIYLIKIIGKDFTENKKIIIQK